MGRIWKKKCAASGKARYPTQVQARDGLAYLLRTVRLPAVNTRIIPQVVDSSGHTPAHHSGHRFAIPRWVGYQNRVVVVGVITSQPKNINKISTGNRGTVDISMSTVAISVRLPKDLLEELDRAAVAEKRSRNWIIVDRLGGLNGRVAKDDGGGKGERSGGGAGVSVLSQAEGDSVVVHPVQSVRSELVGGGQHLQRPAHQGHKIFRAGSGWWCSDCKVNFSGEPKW